MIDGQLSEQFSRSFKYRPPEQREAKTMGLIEIVSGGPLRNDTMCTFARVKELLDRGVATDGHTVSHLILILLDDGRVWEEIAKDEQRLEAIIVKRLLASFFSTGRTGTMRRATWQW